MKKTITTLLIITTLITPSFASQTNTFYLDPITYKDTSTKSNIELTANQKYQNQYKDLVKKLESLNHVKSFLVMKDGQLIVEEYFHSTKPEDSNNIHSASKSILSALVGIAIEEGYIKSIYQPISDFLPREYFIGQSRLKKKITIYNLLTMTSGLKWEEDVTEYQIQNEKDCAKGILSQKQDKYPGKSFNYSTGDTYLLGLVIQNATGKELKTYMEEKLLTPLNITCEYWHKNNDQYTSGCNFFITPKEMVIFGQMILDKGKYKDKQIAPQNWIDISTKEAISLREEEECSYGYLWWIDHIKNHKVITAWGHGGQMIHIIPDKKMVVVFTTDSSGDEEFSFEILEEMLNY